MVVEDYVARERRRQTNNVELIASENFVSPHIQQLVGSCLTNKYAEGFPEQQSIDAFKQIHPDYVHTGNIGRYYGGCQEVDIIELEARYQFQKLFDTDYHVNVQPHSGSQANAAAYMAVLKPGDTVLSMTLSNGAHLTHGSPVSFSGKLYNFVFYDVDDNGLIDYDDIYYKILKHRPKLVLAGASAYSRIIDFGRIQTIIDDASDFIGVHDEQYYRPYFMVDMAHIAGLIAAGEHPSPFGIADIITSTTHKTLRGPRGGLIFCKTELAKRIDSAVFPGTQGGPLLHVIAGKAQCAIEAQSDEYKQYIRDVVTNTVVMANEFKQLGFDVVTGGTDNHLFMLDFSKTHPDISGYDVQKACDAEGITLNKNMVPNDKRTPKETSGVRIGTAAMTTKGWTAANFIDCAHKIADIINKKQGS